METTEVEQVLTTVVRAMVAFREDVRVGVVPGDAGTVLKVHVHHDDVCRLLGPRGRTAEALREVLRVIGRREGVPLLLDVEGPAERPLEVVALSADDLEDEELEDDDEDLSDAPTLRIAL